MTKTINRLKNKIHPPRRLWAAGWLGALLVSVWLFHSHYQLAIVSGDSMLPTLRSGSWMLVDKGAYQKGEPCRGDIVVGRYGAGLVVKRIIGLPGEEVEVKNGELYINGLTCEESQSFKPGPLNVGKGRLFAGDFATLGDNRAIPSRLAVHPILSTTDIVGKVRFAFGCRGMD